VKLNVSLLNLKAQIMENFTQRIRTFSPLHFSPENFFHQSSFYVSNVLFIHPAST